MSIISRDRVKKLTPLKAIRASCLDCSAGSYGEVRNCPSTDCGLWPYRFGRNPEPAEIDGRPSPLKAIRRHCRECVGQATSEIARCTEENACPLWMFRYGRNPRRRGASGRGNPEVLKSWRNTRSHSRVMPPEPTHTHAEVGLHSAQESATPQEEAEPTAATVVTVAADTESETSPEHREETPVLAGADAK